MATTSAPASAPTTSHRSLTSAEDTAPQQSSTDTGMRCPDPSAHHANANTLQNQASAAALYSTNPGKTAHSRSTHLLGSDGKLSSASTYSSVSVRIVYVILIAHLCRRRDEFEVRQSTRFAQLPRHRHRCQVVSWSSCSACEPEPKEP